VITYFSNLTLQFALLADI